MSKVKALVRDFGHWTLDFGLIFLMRPAWLLPTPAHREDEALNDKGLRALLLRLMRGEDLQREEATSLLDALLAVSATDAQIAAALVALAVKGETVEELTG